MAGWSKKFLSCPAVAAWVGTDGILSERRTPCRDKAGIRAPEAAEEWAGGKDREWAGEWAKGKDKEWAGEWVKEWARGKGKDKDKELLVGGARAVRWVPGRRVSVSVPNAGTGKRTTGDVPASSSSVLTAEPR